MKIINTDHKHLKNIVDLAGSYVLNETVKRLSANPGFLVSGFTLTDYENYLKTSDHFYVLIKDDKLAGFLLAYSSDRIKAEEELNSYIKSKNPGPFILIKQICVHRDHKGKGYARFMYDHLFNTAGNTDYFAAIVLNPYNEVSVKFHETYGFIKNFEYTPADGLLRGVWKKKKLP